MVDLGVDSDLLRSFFGLNVKTELRPCAGVRQCLCVSLGCNV